MPNTNTISAFAPSLPTVAILLALLLTLLGLAWLLIAQRTQERWRKAACCLEQISQLLRCAQDILLLEIDRENRLLHETSDRNSSLTRVRENQNGMGSSPPDADQCFREFVRWQNNERNLTQLTWQTLVSHLTATQQAFEQIDEPTHRSMANALLASTRARMVGALQGSNMHGAYLKAIDRQTAETFFAWLRWPDAIQPETHTAGLLDQMERSLILSAYGRGWYEVVEGSEIRP